MRSVLVISTKDVDEIDYASAKFATEHLGHCEHPECRFCSTSTCCFGMRDVGCVILEPELLERVDHVSSFLISANKAFYDRNISLEEVPHAIDQIERGIIEMFGGEYYR